MLYIYCGEDSVAARNLYLQAQEKYKTSGAEIIQVTTNGILEAYKGTVNNLSLFSTQKIFCVENLEKAGFKKSTKAKTDALYEALVNISTNKSIILLDFEDGKQSRQLKLKDLAKVYESKPATSIFQLLEVCIPGNKHSFISDLRVVCETQDEMFTFIMLVRHIRLLVLVSQGIQSTKIPPWQKYKIMGQAGKWDKQKLIDFYSSLIKIEINTKTSSDPYGVAKSIEILASHYL